MILETKLYDGYRVNGPYFIQYDGRFKVDLIKGNHRITMAYSRFLMQEYLDRILLTSEHVDHIDENPLNDDLTNLQVLTHGEHTKKHHTVYVESFMHHCFYCGKDIIMDKKRQGDWTRKQKEGYNGPFCNRSCAAKSRCNVRLE